MIELSPELPITMYYTTKRKFLSALTKIQNRYADCEWSYLNYSITEYVLLKDKEED